MLTFRVDATKPVRPEEVALGLDQICRTPWLAHGVEIRHRA